MGEAINRESMNGGSYKCGNLSIYPVCYELRNEKSLSRRI